MAGEISTAALDLARARLPDAEFLQMSASALPYEDEFDVVGAFDVLEHVEDDDAMLSEMRRAVKRGGGLLITVSLSAGWSWTAATAAWGCAPILVSGLLILGARNVDPRTARTD